MESYADRNPEQSIQLCNTFDQLKEVISGIRNIRLQKNIAQKEALEMQVMGENTFLMSYAEVVKKMGNLTTVSIVNEKPEGAASFMVGTTEYFIPLGGMINVEEELAKLEADLKISGRFPAKRIEEAEQRKVRQQGSGKCHRHGTQKAG